MFYLDCTLREWYPIRNPVGGIFVATAFKRVIEIGYWFIKQTEYYDVANDQIANILHYGGLKIYKGTKGMHTNWLLHEDEIASFHEGRANDKLISHSLLDCIDYLGIVMKQNHIFHYNGFTLNWKSLILINFMIQKQVWFS